MFIEVEASGRDRDVVHHRDLPVAGRDLLGIVESIDGGFNLPDWGEITSDLTLERGAHPKEILHPKNGS